MSEEGARKRLAVHGFSEVSREEREPRARIPAEVLGPLPWLMETAIAVSCAAGRLLEAEVVLFLLALNATLSFAHERSGERVVELLREQLRVEVSMKRSGRAHPRGRPEGGNGSGSEKSRPALPKRGDSTGDINTMRLARFSKNDYASRVVG